MLMAGHQDMVSCHINVGDDVPCTEEAHGIHGYFKLWTGPYESTAHWFYLKEGKGEILLCNLQTCVCELSTCARTHLYTQLNPTSLFHLN